MTPFDPIRFELAACRQELRAFKGLLDVADELQERRDLLPLLRSSPHFCACIGGSFPYMGPANRIRYEFDLFGAYGADLMIGNVDRGAYCAVEFEDAARESVFRPSGRAVPQWSPRLEHGFGQLVDWFHALDDHRKSDQFVRLFGPAPVEFFGLLVVGRSAHLEGPELARLHWRSTRVSVNTHKVYCWTYDQLYASVSAYVELLERALPA